MVLSSTGGSRKYVVRGRGCTCGVVGNWLYPSELADVVRRKRLAGSHKIGGWEVETGKLRRNLNWNIPPWRRKPSFCRSLWSTKPGGWVHAQIWNENETKKAWYLVPGQAGHEVKRHEKEAKKKMRLEFKKKPAVAVFCDWSLCGLPSSEATLW